MTDLQELFSRDPLSLTQNDITAIVEEYRKRRHLFSQGHMSAGKAKAKLTEKEKAAAAAVSVDLKGLL